MALKKANKINASFSMSSMTDIVFLLLIFFMITSTMVNPNALNLLLPRSSNQTSEKAYTSVSITKNYHFYLEGERVAFSKLESKLVQRLKNKNKPCISLFVDKSVPMEQVVKVMNIAKNNKYKLILATSPE
ncbi:MAG: biopolymer transporter ExbD [Marinifilaceae bacterium]|jgi:biopolymer transport protein ExbD|nr:biopolymer transporter ExbD [Marinilabiliaceae bacterium JC040]MCT4600231.1 biopolymer transporter ExbD [Marinifilaceae bacterium]